MQTSIMATTEQLLELMFTWMRSRNSCAEESIKMARELENCIARHSAAAAFVTGATSLTGAAAAPLLDLMGMWFLGVGAAISVATTVTEQVVICASMMDTRDLDKQSNNSAGEIQEKFQQERMQVSVNQGPSHTTRYQSFFTLQLLLSPPGKRLSVKEARQLIKEPSTTGLKTAARMAVGGVGCMESDSLEDQIKESRVTEASQSRRDTTIETLKSNTFSSPQSTLCADWPAHGNPSIGELGSGRWNLKERFFTDFHNSRMSHCWIGFIHRRKFEETTEIQQKHQNTCAESQTDEDSDSEDEDGYSEDEYGEDEDEDGYSVDGDGYGEDEGGEDEDEDDEDEGGDDEEEDDEDDYDEGEDEDEDDEDDYDEDEGGEDEEEDDEDDYDEGEDEDEGGEDDYDEGEDEEEDDEDVDDYRVDEDSYGEDEENYSEDEEHDPQEEDSEEETEDDKSKETGRKRHQPLQSKSLDGFFGRGRISSPKNPRKRKFEDSPNPAPAVRVGLLNVQSMNKKRQEVLDIIMQNNLDVLCTTETWLQRHTGRDVLRDASPLGFSFYHQARPRRGGGVAVQFLNTLLHKPLSFNGTVTTFEVVATLLKHDEWEEPVLVVNVYRPPGSNLAEFQEFLDQFEELLRQADSYNCIIVTGDFNIWFDPETRSFTDEFLWLLPIYDFVQHVKVPTHEAGRILDLVFSRNVEVSRLSVRDDRISDHYTVYFKIRPKPKGTTAENRGKYEQGKRFKTRKK